MPEWFLEGVPKTTIEGTLGKKSVERLWEMWFLEDFLKILEKVPEGILGEITKKNPWRS